MARNPDLRLPEGVVSPARKPRAKRGTGDVGRQKAWECEQRRGPGVFIPIRVNNPLNASGRSRNFWKPYREGKAQRAAAANACRGRIPTTLPAVVTLTRYGRGKLDAGCGLNASLKHVRDGVADVFGVDDGDERYTWAYKQERAPFYGVRIVVTPR